MLLRLRIKRSLSIVPDEINCVSLQKILMKNALMQSSISPEVAHEIAILSIKYLNKNAYLDLMQKIAVDHVEIQTFRCWDHLKGN